jgi:hypothetical protein
MQTKIIFKIAKNYKIIFRTKEMQLELAFDVVSKITKLQRKKKFQEFQYLCKIILLEKNKF